MTGRLQNGLEIQPPGKADTVEEIDISHPTSISRPVEVVDLTTTDDEVSLISTLRVTEMVFLVMRAGDVKTQDIITLRDIWDTHSRNPSWSKFLEMLKDDRWIGFRETEDFLMVDDRIRVGNERQFLACVQYLRNSMAWNTDILVYSY